MTGTPTATDAAPTSTLDSRYGRTPSRRRRRRVIVISAAVLGVLIVGSWVWWVGLLTPTAQIDTETLRYSHGDNSIIVQYQVTVDTGTAVTCAVEALDDRFGVVGWKVVALPASDQRVRQLSAEVRISQPATTGLIENCWTA